MLLHRFFSRASLLSLVAAAGLVAKADTFSINGAGVEGSAALTFSIPTPATPDSLEGNSFSIDNIPITLLFGFSDNPPPGTVGPGTVSFSDNGDGPSFDIESAVGWFSGTSADAIPFFSVENGQVTFLTGQYGFIGIGTSYFMSISPDESTTVVPEPASLVLMATGALLCLKDGRWRRIAARSR